MKPSTPQTVPHAALPSLPSRPFSARGLQGVLMLVAATLCFGFLDAGTQTLSPVVPVLVLVWSRFAAQLGATLVLELPRRGRALWRCQAPGLQVLRGVLLVALNALSVLSLMVMPVGEFTAIVMLTPLAITLVSATMMKEAVSLKRWLLVAGGFAGALVVIRPGAADFQWSLLLPVVTMLANTGFQVLSGRLGRRDLAITTHFYTGLVGTAVCSLALPWFWPVLDARQWSLVFGLGLLCALGHQLLVTAYAQARLSVLAPFLYFQIPFAVLAGWLVLGQRPDAVALLGIGLIAACGATGTWLSTRDPRPADGG